MMDFSGMDAAVNILGVCFIIVLIIYIVLAAKLLENNRLFTKRIFDIIGAVILGVFAVPIVSLVFGCFCMIFAG
jgi:lipopolysaccharide/colanic/teichoic acid biosynthesis glycosyltransferase